MPKAKKAPEQFDWNSLKEELIRQDIEPAKQLLRKLVEELDYPDTGDKEKDKQIWDSLKESYELFVGEKGQVKLRLKTSKRVEIELKLLEYLYPKLRGTEVRGSIDHTFNISIQTFDSYEPAKIIEMSRPAQINDTNRESS